MYICVTEYGYGVALYFLFSASLAPLISGMTGKYLFAQLCGIQVHIYFRGIQTLVSQHFLYGTQVGPAHQQMCGKTVSEGVRRYFLLNSCLCSILLNEYEE